MSKLADQLHKSNEDCVSWSMDLCTIRLETLLEFESVLDPVASRSLVDLPVVS